MRDGGRTVEGKRQRKINDVLASSGVFGLLLLAYHGNYCYDPSHLDSTPQGPKSVKARRL